MSDEGDIIIYAAGGFIGGLVLFYYGLVWFRLKRLIQNIPTSKVRSIAMGLTEVYGDVEQEKKMLKSPLLNRDCVYYEYSIKEKRGSGKNSHWTTISSGKEAVPFYLKDDTGKVLVDPSKAKIDVKTDLNKTTRSLSSLPLDVRNYYDRQGIKHRNVIFNRSRCYTETIIEPKDKVYVLGTAMDNPLVEDTTGQKNEEDIMIAKGKNEKIFYINDKPESAVISSLTWKSFGGVIGGGLLSVVCLGIILGMLGLL